MSVMLQMTRITRVSVIQSSRVVLEFTCVFQGQYSSYRTKRRESTVQSPASVTDFEIT